MGGVWLTGGALQRSRELTKTIFCGHSLGIICALSSNKASKFCLISAEKKSPVINLRWRLLKSWACVRSNICPKRDSYGRGRSPLNVLDLVSTNKIWGAMAWRSSSSSRRINNNSLLHIDVLLIHLYPFESIKIHLISDYASSSLIYFCLSATFISPPLCSLNVHSRLI